MRLNNVANGNTNQINEEYTSEPIPDLVSVIVIKTNNSIEYVNLETGESIKTIFDIENGTIVSTDYQQNLYGVSGRRYSWQGVVNCVSDAYNNHGFASLWLWAQSMYIPATGLVIGFRCLAKNLPTNQN